MSKLDTWILLTNGYGHVYSCIYIYIYMNNGVRARSFTFLVKDLDNHLKKKIP